MSKPTIKAVIQNVHMGLGHDGLCKLLKKGIELDVRKLAETELVLCINKHGDKLKIIGAKGLVIGYLKMPDRQRIMFDALQYLPQTFGASGFDYNAACKKSLERRFKSYPKPRVTPPRTGQDRSQAVA